MGLKEKLMNIQVELKAPKNLYNNFGKYAYRNAEGICNAVKPFLRDQNVMLTLSDSLEAVGDRIYVKGMQENRKARKAWMIPRSLERHQAMRGNTL